MTQSTLPVTIPSPAPLAPVIEPCQFKWEWGGVPEATGYKISPVNDISTATDLGAMTSFVETGLGGSLTYTRYVWAYNTCGFSAPAQLTATASPDFCIGQYYQGGNIVYIDGTGLHGLIAAPADYAASVAWTNGTPGPTGAQGTAIGLGNENTNKIVTAFGNTGIYAAKICLGLSVNGYDDWFLPSKDELNQVYVNRIYLTGMDELSEYWSSSESTDGYHPWYQFFSGGVQLTADPSMPKKVRAVRQF